MQVTPIFPHPSLTLQFLADHLTLAYPALRQQSQHYDYGTHIASSPASLRPYRLMVNQLSILLHCDYISSLDPISFIPYITYGTEIDESYGMTRP